MKLSLLVAALALVAVSGAGGGGSATKTIGTRGAVVSISADGGTVAIHAAVTGDPDCDSGSAWAPATGKVVRFQDTPCGKQASQKQYDALTLGGSRAVWADYDYGNHAYCNGPYVATLAKPKPVDSGVCPDEPDNSDMYWEFAGDGTLLVARSYFLCEASCPPDYDRSYDDEVTIWRVGAGLTKLLAAKDDTKLLDVDAGRILLRDPSKKLLVLNAGGKQVGGPVTPPEVRAAFMSGAAQVVGASKGSKLTHVRRRHREGRQDGDDEEGRQLMDVENGVAAYFSAHRCGTCCPTIATDRDRLVATQKGLIQADLEPQGLFYAYNVPGGGSKPGRVTFVPASQLSK